VRVFVPTADSEAVQKLRAALGTDKSPVNVGVVTAPPKCGGKRLLPERFDKIGRVGRRMQLGWAVWQHSNLFIEGEPHAIHDPENGQPWNDPTPNFFPDGSRCTQILFFPNDAIRDPQSIVIEDNIRVPLVDDPQLSKGLKLASERIALRNRARTEGESDALTYQFMQLEFRIATLLSAAEQRHAG
jgi:hypothetical protein